MAEKKKTEVKEEVKQPELVPFRAFKDGDKYKDDIFPFHENSRGKTINIMLLLDDEPGLLSNVLNEIAKCRANILTIHQSIPIGGIASVTLGMEMRPETKEVNEIITAIEGIHGINSLKILGRE